MLERFGAASRGRAVAALAGAALAALGVAARPARGQGADLLVGSFLSDAILRYDASTGAFLGPLVPSGSGGLAGPDFFTPGPDGRLYVGSFFTSSILRFDGATGAFQDVFVPSGSGGLHAPHRFVWGPDGNLYVASRGSSSVLRYDGATGAFLDVFVPPGRGALNDPTDLFFRDGLLYVVDFTTDGRPPALDDPAPPGRGGAVRRYDATTGAFVDEFIPPGSGGLDGPHAVEFGPDGNLYVASTLAQKILRFDGRTGAFLGVFIDPSAAAVPGPLSRAWVEHTRFVGSHALVTTFDCDCVMRFDATTGAFVDVLVQPQSGGLSGPGFMLVVPSAVPEPRGALLVAAGVAAIALRTRRRRPAG